MTVWIQNPFDNLPFEGHRKQRYWMMAEAFVAAGHRVVYWSSDFSHATKKRRLMTPLVCNGIEMRWIPTKPYRRNVGLARVASHRRYARDWVDDACVDSSVPHLIVSSCPTISGAEAALELGGHHGVKVVIDVQDAWPETFERLAPCRLRKVAHLALSGLSRRVRRIYREADLVTGVCERYRELTGREDYSAFYLGVPIGEPCRRRSHVSGMPIRLVYSGNMGVSYDLATLVRAVEDNEDFTLDIAGNGAFRSECERIRFHGYLSDDDLRKLLRSCEVGVIPMNDDSLVGIPNKMFDYAEAGLAVVSSLGGETGRLLREYGCGATYRAGDAASLAEAVRIAAHGEPGASRYLAESRFDSRQIYAEYVAHVTGIVKQRHF